MAKTFQESTLMLNIKDKLDLKGDKIGKKLFAVSFECADQDGDKSFFVKVYRSNTSKECQSQAQLDFPPEDMFGNTTMVKECLEIGDLR